MKRVRRSCWISILCQPQMVAGGVDTVEALSTWLEEAHENVGAAFRAALTDSVYHGFKE